MVNRTLAKDRYDSYVYVIFRLNGIPCYVGKGKRDRCFQHIKCSHNRYLQRIIAKEGPDLPIIKIRENITDETANETEIALISVIGRYDLMRGPLVNLTNGGDGVVGHTRGPEQRAKLSAARRGRPTNPGAIEKIRAALSGKLKTPDHAAAVSAAKKGVPGKKPSDETKARMSASQRAAWTPERRISQSATMLIVQANMADEIKARKSARITAALTGKKLSEAHKAKISAVQVGKKGLPHSLKARAAISAARKGKKTGPLSPQALANFREKRAAWRRRLADVADEAGC